MATNESLIAQPYSAFNRRDIDGALAIMGVNVDWPKASEGGRVIGKDAIRAYWTRQWTEFDPHVEPVSFRGLGAGMTDVTVHQLVRSLSGEVLSDLLVTHVFTISGGLIERMDIGGGESAFDHNQ